MAQKYVVKKDDNLLKVARRTGVSPTAIKTANGIKTLTPGQTIRVPTNFSDERGWDGTPVKTLSARERDLQAGAANQGGGGGNQTTVPANNYNSYGAGVQYAPTGSFLAGGGNTALAVAPAPFQTPAQGSFVSGGGQVNIPRNPTTSGMLSPEKNAVLPRTILSSGSFYSGAGEVNLTGVSAGQDNAGGGNNGGDGGYNQYGNWQYTASARPQVPFEQDPAAWRAYWNYSAQHPETVESVVTQYRPTIRELKDKQRRSEGGSEWEQEASYSSFRPIDPNFYGNNVNTALSWRVG